MTDTDRYNNTLIILVSLVILFDIIGAHLYSKFTLLLLLVFIIKTNKPPEMKYVPTGQNDDIEL